MNTIYWIGAAIGSLVIFSTENSFYELLAIILIGISFNMIKYDKI